MQLSLLAQVQKLETDTLDSRVSRLIEAMSLKQKVFEMHGHGIAKFGLGLVFAKRFIPVKFGGNKKLGIPAGVFADGPRGLSLYKGAAAFPVTMARAASWDRDLERRVGLAMSEECRAMGANYSGALCVNLLRHPADGRAQECYGEDPYLTGEMGMSLMLGIQANQVQACVKHFALNSMENNRFGGNFIIDERCLHEVYLPHFKKIVQAGVASVMSGYNQVNGEYCGHNSQLLMDILRKEWGFKGYITSDWQYGLFDAKKGIHAQMNVEMPSGKIYSLKHVKQLLNNKSIGTKDIDQLIYPILRTKLIFQSQSESAARVYPKSLIGCTAHVDLAREVAEKSIVLLKNESDLLPLDKQQIHHIVLMGSQMAKPQTGDKGSSNVLAKDIVSLQEALHNYCLAETKISSIEYKDISDMNETMKEADIVIVFAGFNFEDEGEFISTGKLRDSTNPDKQNIATRLGMFALGGDRPYLHLHKEDLALIEWANSMHKKVIVCLQGGSAITVEEWQAETPAILHCFYVGMQQGNAIVNILFGEVNPSGKLPFTIPIDIADLPSFNLFASVVNYDMYHGYTLLDKSGKWGRYAFGFGLSYTQFELDHLQTNAKKYTLNDTIEVRVDLHNMGARAGAEVVQVYVGFEQSKIDRAEKLLRAFEKVYLEAQESKQIVFRIPVRELAWYNPVNHEWEVEQMDYDLLVGNSSADAHFQKCSFSVY